MILIPGFNPGKMTLEGTNTYLLGTGKERLLIDTGEGKAQYKEKLESILIQEQCTISIILITHHHYDHTGGINQVLELCPKAKVHKSLDQNLEEDKHFTYEPIQDGQIFEVEGFTIKAISHPGHCKDHYSFLGNQNSWFSGDSLLGGSSCYVENYKEYVQSMEKILQMNIESINPGHGYQILENGKQAIEKQLQHRKMREQQILDVLNGQSVDELLKIIYPTINDNYVLGLARKGIVSHLDKLLDENRVICKDNMYFKIQ